MKIKQIFGAALLMALPLTFTSCDEDIWGEWSRPTPTSTEVTPTTVDTTIDLSSVTTNTTIEDGYTITGTLGANVKISIADGATVTLSGATINGTDDENYAWAGLTCEGDATIILADGTENTVTGFDYYYPGISVPENKTLTIQGETAGTGKLTASGKWGSGIGGASAEAAGNIVIESGVIIAKSSESGAGIGSGYDGSCGSITINGGTITATATSNNSGPGIGAGCVYNHSGSCGNITISGGTVTATGGFFSAGIGTGQFYSNPYKTTSLKVGDITISGGTVTATGGANAAGIGTGVGYQYNPSPSNICGDITITSGVTSVTATKGTGWGAYSSLLFSSIGAGAYGNCGTVTIESGANVTEN